ncbi:MAG: GDP-mannose 4,6-dehydratase [Thaumarchaeota archaeon]|jgi:GDPmannose 4,6-dehydratase|nr:MAG: GDP-mannose 4,6-dehydratase [Nitrososphaerota archaeon]
MKKALITGITGQDGAYLAKFLCDKGYQVFGTYRRLSSLNFWRLGYLGILDKVKLIEVDQLDFFSISKAIEESNPDEIYNFAAQSFVSSSYTEPYHTFMINGLGPLNVLEAIKQKNMKVKFYQASSSEMYGNYNSVKKNETTGFSPTSPYAIAKTSAHYTTKMYRETYDMFAVNGILFNHESPLRGLDYVTRKISNQVARISLGLDKKIELGNLDAKRDWGFAQEFVIGIWKMLQQKKPDDFVLATGQSHSVREFAEAACDIAGISKNCVVSNKKYFRPSDVNELTGDSSKAKKILGWKPRITFPKLVKMMIEEDIKRWENFLKKEYFPWDVNSPTK